MDLKISSEVKADNDSAKDLGDLVYAPRDDGTICHLPSTSQTLSSVGLKHTSLSYLWTPTN